MKYGRILIVIVLIAGGVSPGAAVAQEEPMPETKIDPPRSISYSSHAKFEVTASVKNARFECRLDNEVFADCPLKQSSQPTGKSSSSEETKANLDYRGLPPGVHTLGVRASEVRADEGKRTDPTPASVTWTVIKSRVDVIPGYVIPVKELNETVPVGWTLAVAPAITTDHFAVVSEVSGDYRTVDTAAGEIQLTRYAFLNGVHFVARSLHADWFIQGLAGFVRSNDDAGPARRFSNNLGWQIGTGGDFNVSRGVAVRFSVAHRHIYLDRTRREWRIGTGVVLRLNGYD